MMHLSRLRTIAGIAVTLVSLVTVPVFPQQTPRELYERARLLDESNHKLTEAIKLYKQVVSQAKAQRALAARAQYRVGVLYERLGRKAEALKAFNVVVSQYPDQMDVARRARAKLAAAAASSKTNHIVVKQAGPSPDGRYLATFTFLAKQGVSLSRPAIDPAGRRLYVITNGVTEPNSDADRKRLQQQGRRYVYWPSTLVVIDTDTNAIVKTIRFSLYLHSIAFNPANHKLYATAHVNGHVKTIDVNTFSETEVPVPGYPTHIDINPITNKIYVTSQGFDGHDKLFVIDGATNTVAGPFDLDGVANTVIVNPATNRIYAPAEPKTRVFNGGDNSVLTDLPGIRVIGVDPNQNRVSARAFSPGQVARLQVLDGNIHRLIATLELGVVDHIAVNSVISRLYVALWEKKQVAVIATTNHTELGRLSVADVPMYLTVDGATGRVYVCHSSSPPLLGVLAEDVLAEEVPEEFFDPFDGATLDTAWTVHTGQGSYSLTENPGHLRHRVAVPSGPTPRLLLVRKFRGCFWIFETKVSYFTGVSGGGRDLSFSITFGAMPVPGAQPSDSVDGFRLRHDWNGCCAGETRLSFVENGVRAHTKALPPNATNAHVWRITRHGRTVTVERSDDGINFTLVGAHTFGPQIDGLIQYLSISFNTHANNDAYADYDFVRLSKMPAN